MHICWISDLPSLNLVDSFSHYLPAAQCLQMEKMKDPGQWAHFTLLQQFIAVDFLSTEVSVPRGHSGQDSSLFCKDNTLQYF